MMAHTSTNRPRIPLILGLLGLIIAGSLGCIEGDSSTDQDVDLRSSTGLAAPTDSTESTGPDPNDTTTWSPSCWDPCPTFFSDLNIPNGDSIRCSCAQLGSPWDVYGTDIYRGDSDTCAAAVHAGAIGSSGGFVEVTARPGESSYSGSLRYGVETRDSDEWPSSFEVQGTSC